MVARNPDPEEKPKPLEEALELRAKAEATMRHADIGSELLSALAFTPEQVDAATTSAFIMTMQNLDIDGVMDDLAFGLMMLVRKLQREAL